MNIVWVDDDVAPESGKLVAGPHTISVVGSCGEAATLLRSLTHCSMVILDPIVPQNGWRDPYLEYPGIEFVKYVKERCPGAKVVVYGAVMDDGKRQRARDAGADGVISKSDMGLLELVEELSHGEGQDAFK